MPRNSAEDVLSPWRERKDGTIVCRNCGCVQSTGHHPTCIEAGEPAKPDTVQSVTRLAAHRARLRAAFLRGWDAAIACRNTNPYRRSDFADRWQSGYRRCMAGDDLPSWAKAAQ
jgi:ribosome modulation factor